MFYEVDFSVIRYFKRIKYIFGISMKRMSKLIRYEVKE